MVSYASLAIFYHPALAPSPSLAIFLYGEEYGPLRCISTDYRIGAMYYRDANPHEQWVASARSASRTGHQPTELVSCERTGSSHVRAAREFFAI